MIRDPQAGVTLVEMLVAVALTALIGVAGFTMLDAILRVDRRASETLDQLAELDRAFLVMARDLQEARANGMILVDDTLFLSQTRSIAVEEGRLIRRIGAPPVAQTLVDGVTALRWRVLDAGRDWHEAWPVDAAAPPVAAEAALTLADGAEVARLFLLTPGTAP